VAGGSLEKAVQYIKGVGPERAKLLEKLGIMTVKDLLYYLPREWVDRSNIKPIIKVQPGALETVSGLVIASETRQVRNRLKITKVTIKDNTGFISGVWYNQPYIEKTFKRGFEVIFHGKIDTYGNSLQIGNPEYEIMDEEAPTESESINVNRIVPIYPLTEKLYQKQLRKIIKFALDNYLTELADDMPEEVRQKYSLPVLKDSIYALHFPVDFKSLEEAKKRLIFDEFFFLQLALALQRCGIKKEKGRVFDTAGPSYTQLIKTLPYELTGAQKRVIEEIRADLISGSPMNRLLQGDVGSGKTIVALACAVMAKDSGCQAAVMAPTELLAIQHMNNITSLFGGSGVRAELLTGAAPKAKRAAILEGLKDGSIDIVVGTHALLQDDVVFKNLGFAVIDEQHRFGVMQRQALVKKGIEAPHCLIMTATPIPRTLSMTVYGDTDVSVIDEMPPGRKPIITKVYGARSVEKLYNDLEARLKEKAQIYAVYPLVAESEKMDLKSAIEMEKHLALRFKDYRTAIIHGQMKKDERDEAMIKFKKREIDILVATTVIEVGIDVPNATVMMIEHADRFGLSQLHQLRGRVGRGDKQSYCILVDEGHSEDSRKRLDIMEETQDGFKISEKDLEIRGPGEFMGSRQHGISDFKIANILRDRAELARAREAAFGLVSDNCDVNHSAKEQLVRIIKQRYGASFDLINIG
jgi:ATP-dependent DNA helicase RecG